MSKYPTSEEVIVQLCKKYRGLRKEDLCEVNPGYSCVICGKLGCKHIGDKNYPEKIPHVCGDCEPCNENEFALRYDFDQS